MKIGIFGCGAVGLSVTGMLYNDNKDDIYLLVKDKYYDLYKDGIIVNGSHYNVNITDNIKMDYIILAVKNYDLDKALIDMSTFVSNNTKILPLLNGIVAHDKIKDYYKDNIVYYGMIRIEANRIDYNNVCCSNIGEIAFGNEYNYNLTNDIIILRDIFLKSYINVDVSLDMKRAVWKKWMLNIGINQVSALTNATYKDMHSLYHEKLLYNLMSEIVLLAKYENINLTYDDVNYFILESKKWNSDRVTSLTCDFMNKRRNELDYFSKTALDLASKHNINLPYNNAIYLALKAISFKF